MPIYLGDCLERLKSFETNSLDSLVTDPPAGISFMGKAWDDDKGGRDSWIAWMTEVMSECLRVLKPGAHGLVWALPRTSHWTATALENAGFEVRDVVTHLFGTGFPKSLNIGLAIDKQAGAPNRGKAVLNIKGAMTERDDRDYSQKGEPYEASTPAAKQWSGWGTALKPASEHWILVRKPLSEKTVAANMLKYGTGGINIDSCRIAGHNPSIDRRATARKTGNTPGSPGEYGATIKNRISAEAYTSDHPSEQLGRFPANIVLSHNDDCDETCTDGCAVKALDEQSGVSGEKLRIETVAKSLSGYGAEGKSFKGVRGHGDSGGASRFFYCAKASKQDRNRKVIHDGEQAPDSEVNEADELFDQAGNPTRGDCA